jgi:hypothetical protein
VEFAMTSQPRIPDPETAKRLLANLRRSRLAMEAATLELEDITMQLENDSRQRRLVRLRQAINDAEAASFSVNV